MPKTSRRLLARTVLDAHGRTYAEEIGIRLKDAPAPLFQLLTASLLLSARIPAGNAVRAARALLDARFTTPKRMAEATWQERVDVITWHGYKRYDERTSTMLGETAEMVLARYHGDLRELRREADRDSRSEHRLLQQFKGIGKVGADIFLREVQVVWQEAFPYADSRVTQAAATIGLPADPRALSHLVDRRDFPRLSSGLVRMDLAKAQEQVRKRASEAARR